jgi:hypothetical protein
MCDFSLRHVAARAARLGDQLVSTEFERAVTRGFAAVAEPDIAVCLKPGTELAFLRPVECDHPLASFPVRTLPATVARFRRINPDNPHEHHDALEFPDGEVVLLTRLCPGQRAIVLQLPLAISAPKKAVYALTHL